MIKSLLNLLILSIGMIFWTSCSSSNDQHQSGIDLFFSQKEGYGRISPDGTKFSFIHPDSRQPYLKNIQTGIEKPLNPGLTWDGRNVYLAQSIWSPDSQRIVYSWVDKFTGPDLRIFDVKSGNYIIITPPGLNKFAPWPMGWAKNHIILAVIYKDQTNETLLLGIHADSHVVDTLRVIAQDSYGSMDISPDGNLVAYDQVGSDGNSNIVLFSLDGIMNKTITSGSSDKFMVSWLPDSKSLIYGSRYKEGRIFSLIEMSDNLEVMTDREISPMLKDYFSPAGVSPRGEFYFLTMGRKQNIWLANVSEEFSIDNERIIVSHENQNWRPNWRDKGDDIVFFDLDKETKPDTFLTILNTSNGSFVRKNMGRSGGRILPMAPEFSEVNSQLIYFFLPDSIFQYNCCVSDYETSEYEFTIANCSYPVFSQTGSIYYIFDNSILHYNPVSQLTEEIYRSGQSLSQLEISGDDHFLVFLEWGNKKYRPKKLKLYDLLAQNCNTIWQIEDNQQFTPFCRPEFVVGNQKVLVSVSDDPISVQQLYLVDLIGGEKQKVDEPLEGLGKLRRNIRLHPNNDQMVFTRLERISKLWKVNIKASLEE